ncbi:MAG TPA: PilZ domain-containing protein, partial [Acidimicrobiales bacterium]|nr:PilZ domain-containing protein [Acidimicrobiales bacterium]
VLPRQFADWEGQIQSADDAEGPWQACRVVDVSPGGAGLELGPAGPPLVPGEAVAIEIRLSAEVRHVSAVPGGVRVGVQFVGLTEVASRYLEAMSKLETGW